MKHVTMKREHRYKTDDEREIILPRGWSGEVADEVAEEARSMGRIVEDPRAARPSEAPADGTDLDSLRKDQLVALAKERGVVIESDDKKEDILAALKKAEAASQSAGEGGLFGDGLDGKSREELQTIAKEKNVTVAADADAATIIAAIRAAVK